MTSRSSQLKNIYYSEVEYYSGKLNNSLTWLFEPLHMLLQGPEMNDTSVNAFVRLIWLR